MFNLKPFDLHNMQVSDGGVPKATDALSGELWEAKKERIRDVSVFGKSSDWDLRSVSRLILSLSTCMFLL